MQDVVDADFAWSREHGRLPTLLELGAELGLSRERVRQIRAQIDRYRSFPRQHDDHVRRWRLLFTEALDAIRKAVASRENAVRSRSEAAELKLLRKFDGFARKLKLLGPHRTWPRWQTQGPILDEFAEAQADLRRKVAQWLVERRRAAFANIKARCHAPPAAMWDAALCEAEAEGWLFVNEKYWGRWGIRPWMRWMDNKKAAIAEADWRARRRSGDVDRMLAWKRAS
jgi:hypothetical protein